MANEPSARALILFLLLSGCVEAHEVSEPHFADAVDPDQPRIVEWDLWFPNQAAQDAYYRARERGLIEKGGVFTQASTDNWLTWNDGTDLRYCVTESFGDYERVVDEMALATGEWEERANVNFKHVVSEDDDCDPGNANVDFVVGVTTYAPFPFVLYGCGTRSLDNWEGTLPNPTCPTGQGNEGYNDVLFLNYDAMDDAAMNGEVWTSLGTIRHELGHVLGLRHEFVWSDPSCEPEEYEGYGGVQLTEHDPDSVMHYPGGCGIPEREYEISELDGVALRKLYGMPVSWYVGAGLI